MAARPQPGKRSAAARAGSRPARRGGDHSRRVVLVGLEELGLWRPSVLVAPPESPIYEITASRS